MLVDDRTDVAVGTAPLLGGEVQSSVEAICQNESPVGEDKIHHRFALVRACLSAALPEPAQKVSQLGFELGDSRARRALAFFLDVSGFHLLDVSFSRARLADRVPSSPSSSLERAVLTALSPSVPS